MVIGTHIINDDTLHPRVSVYLSITVPMRHRNGETKYIKPGVGIELDVPTGTEPEEFMDNLEQFVLGKLDQYITDLDKWSATSIP
jgi:hypothetical protein